MCICTYMYIYIYIYIYRGVTYHHHFYRWWASGALDHRCELFIVMGRMADAVARPPHQAHAMLLVPRDTPGEERLIHTHTHAHTHTNTHIHTHTHTHTQAHARTHMCTLCLNSNHECASHTSVTCCRIEYALVRVSKIYVCKNIYTYIYIRTYIHIDIYIHIYTHTSVTCCRIEYALVRVS